MDSEGKFHLKENDGKLSLEYHHEKYHPITQKQNQSSIGETTIHDNPLEPHFLCPRARWLNGPLYGGPLDSPPEYDASKQRTYYYHGVLPLFWCNNKEFDSDGGCYICHGSNFGIDYYWCDYCGRMFHKECVQSPSKIKHPYHPQHSLQLYIPRCWDLTSTTIGLCCERRVELMVYYCTICKVSMHTICAMKTIPFVIHQPKRHDHPLSFFPRQTSLTCNVCGLLRELKPTYVCLKCNFVAHNDCMYFQHTIKISRHHHRISYTSFLKSGKWLCGVCRQSIDCDYGAYSCFKCSDYVVHSICALGKDVCDGKELEGVLEEDDISKDDAPFNMISKGVIQHFLHDHCLQLEVNIHYDDTKFCQMCVLPIFKGNIYSCMECDFIFHEECAMSPRRIQHALHPHPLTLKAQSGYSACLFWCNACARTCCGFVYQCPIKECKFDLDVRCASIYEPFDYKRHRHPLFLALDPKEKPTCHICETKCRKQLNCIKCDFIVCFKCATLPNNARYKHDEHFLEILCGEEVCEQDCCEVCERDFKDTHTKLVYWCKECCTTFHIECLLGEDPYMKPDRIFYVYNDKVQILSKSNISRPLCDSCKNPCQGNIFKIKNFITCSVKCARVV